MSVILRSLGASIAPLRMSNEDIAERLDTTDEWIRSHTGIGARHFAPKGTMTSDMAAEAARKALTKAGIGPKELDLIVLATATPDYFGFPATACIVQEKIGAYGVPAFDITAGCTGFIYALDAAASMLEARHGRHALVIGSDLLSRIADWSDRSTAVLFGDGAGAAVVSRIDEAAFPSFWAPRVRARRISTWSSRPGTTSGNGARPRCPPCAWTGRRYTNSP